LYTIEGVVQCETVNYKYKQRQVEW